MAVDGHHYQGLVDLAEQLCHLNDYCEVLQEIGSASGRLFQADVTLIALVNPRTRETVKTVFKDGTIQADDKKYKILQTQISGWMLKYGQPFFSADIQRDKRFAPALFSRAAVKRVLGARLQTEGIVIGTVLQLYKRSSSAVSESDLPLLQRFAAVVAPHLHNVKRQNGFFDTELADSELAEKYAAVGLVGRSPAFLELLHLLDIASNCNIRVLIQGNSGTGKELVARAIHLFSPRAEREFVAVDCGAIPEHLIESELFGHVRGAFTGASGDRKGLFEVANGGTLFLDEISNLPMNMQVRLMRALQENEIRRVGGNKTIPVNVRVIAASSSNLRELKDKNLFREDLFFRLNVYPIHVPDLHDRQQDIPVLANYFLEQLSARNRKRYFHENVVDFIKKRDWPGNVRELQNFVERLLMLTPPDQQQIDISTFPEDVLAEFQLSEKEKAVNRFYKSLKEQLAEHEHEIIKRALLDHDWNQSQAARSLRMSEQNMRYRMKKLGIVRMQKTDEPLQ